MQTFGQITRDILEAMNRVNDPDMELRVRNAINIVLPEICAELSVAQLRDKVTLDFSDDSYDTGMLLPSDLIGIDEVKDSDGYSYYERNRFGIDPDEAGYRYYRYYPRTTPLIQGTDLSVTNEGSSFTSATLDAAIVAETISTAVGEYVRFGQGAEYYKITTNTSPYSFTPTYYGPTLTNADVMVRPEETQRMVLIDPTETALTDRTMTVYYWKAPRALYRASDRVPLATAMPLVLRVLRRMPEAKERRPVSQGEIDRAMAMLKRLNPAFPRHPNVRGVTNKPMSYSTNPFKTR